jgi:Glycosyltransferase family 87
VNAPMKSSSRGAWLLRWSANQRKTIYLFALVLASCWFFLLIYFLQIWHAYKVQSPGYLFNDFFSLWSYAKIASAHPATELYDLATLHSRQVALGMDPSSQFPFLYPPTFIIYLWPLNLLPIEVAYLVWIVGTLALFVWAVVGTCTRLPLCVLGVIIAPACTMNIDSGQSGFFSAALIIAGVRLAGSRPILGGILIGILSYKPQLGFLVPIALASAGLWTAIGAACATVIGLAMVATLAFGWAVWPAWASMLPVYAELLDGVTPQLKFMPTVMANLQMAGVTLPIARVAQAIAAITVAILVSGCFRRSPGRLATAALLVGTFLATPHALLYDMPMVIGAMALFIEARLQTGSTFCVAEILILVLALMFPVLMMNVDVNLPVSAVPMLLLFGLILWHEKSGAAIAETNY